MKATVVGLSLCASLPSIAADSHCSKREQTVFSCSVGTKIVSVCASKEISPTSGYIQYRFGKRKAPELTFPASKELADRSLVRSGILLFSGGGGAYLRFVNGRYSYVIYSAIGKGWGAKDGVAVEKDEKPIANLSCQGIPTSMLGEEFFSLVGLTADQREFSLP